MAMSPAISSLTSSLSSLSFSSQISQKPGIPFVSLHRSKSISISPKNDKTPKLVVSATEAAPAELETTDLKKYVKSRLPGGFAAQTIFGTGRRKCAIARVVLQEGTGKFIINYRDAKVSSLSFYLLLILILILFIYAGSLC